MSETLYRPERVSRSCHHLMCAFVKPQPEIRRLQSGVVLRQVMTAMKDRGSLLLTAVGHGSDTGWSDKALEEDAGEGKVQA